LSDVSEGWWIGTARGRTTVPSGGGDVDAGRFVAAEEEEQRRSEQIPGAASR
jgi:hypothetical protein